MEIRASKDKGSHIGGPHDKDNNILGFVTHLLIETTHELQN